MVKVKISWRQEVDDRDGRCSGADCTTPLPSDDHFPQPDIDPFWFNQYVVLLLYLGLLLGLGSYQYCHEVQHVSSRKVSNTRIRRNSDLCQIIMLNKVISTSTSH